MIYIIIICLLILTVELINAAEVVSEPSLALIRERLKEKAIQEAEYSGQIIEVDDDYASATAEVFFEDTPDDDLTPGDRHYTVYLTNINVFKNE